MQDLCVFSWLCSSSRQGQLACDKSSRKKSHMSSSCCPIQSCTECTCLSEPSSCCGWADSVNCLQGNVHAGCPSLEITWEALQKRTPLSCGWLMEVMQDSSCHQADRTRTYASALPSVYQVPVPRTIHRCHGMCLEMYSMLCLGDHGRRCGTGATLERTRAVSMHSSHSMPVAAACIAHIDAGCV